MGTSCYSGEIRDDVNDTIPDQVVVGVSKYELQDEFETGGLKGMPAPTQKKPVHSLPKPKPKTKHTRSEVPLTNPLSKRVTNSVKDIPSLYSMRSAGFVKHQGLASHKTTVRSTKR